MIVQWPELTVKQLESSDFLNPLRANTTKWPSTLKQFVGKLPANCLSVFHHFVKLALKGLKFIAYEMSVFCCISMLQI